MFHESFQQTRLCGRSKPSRIKKGRGGEPSRCPPKPIPSRLSELLEFLDAIEFTLEGTVLSANQNFLDVFGYRLDEIKGKPL